MSKTTHERRSLLLSPDEWKALERLAETLDATAKAGPTFGQPSWRALIKEIANGDLIVIHPDQLTEHLQPNRKYALP